MQTPEVNQTHIDPSPYHHADTIRRQMEGLAPGSEAERAVLEQVRERNQNVNNQRQAIRGVAQAALNGGKDHLVLASETSRRASSLAEELMHDETHTLHAVIEDRSPTEQKVDVIMH